MAFSEYFAPGTEPTEVCDCHVSAAICGTSGMVATDFCPHTGRTTKVFMVRPKGSTGTTDDSKYEMPDECNVHTAVSPGDILDDLLGGGDKNNTSGDKKDSKDSKKSGGNNASGGSGDSHKSGAGISDILKNNFN